MKQRIYIEPGHRQDGTPVAGHHKIIERSDKTQTEQDIATLRTVLTPVTGTEHTYTEAENIEMVKTVPKGVLEVLNVHSSRIEPSYVIKRSSDLDSIYEQVHGAGNYPEDHTLLEVIVAVPPSTPDDHTSTLTLLASHGDIGTATVAAFTPIHQKRLANQPFTDQDLSDANDIIEYAKVKGFIDVEAIFEARLQVLTGQASHIQDLMTVWKDTKYIPEQKMFIDLVSHNQEFLKWVTETATPEIQEHAHSKLT